MESVAPIPSADTPVAVWQSTEISLVGWGHVSEAKTEGVFLIAGLSEICTAGSVQPSLSISKTVAIPGVIGKVGEGAGAALWVFPSSTPGSASWGLPKPWARHFGLIGVSAKGELDSELEWLRSRPSCTETSATATPLLRSELHGGCSLRSSRSSRGGVLWSNALIGDVKSLNRFLTGVACVWRGVSARLVWAVLQPVVIGVVISILSMAESLEVLLLL